MQWMWLPADHLLRPTLPAVSLSGFSTFSQMPLNMEHIIKHYMYTSYLFLAYINVGPNYEA